MKTTSILEITSSGLTFKDLGLVNQRGGFSFDEVVPIPEELPREARGDEYLSLVCFFTRGFQSELDPEEEKLASEIANKTSLPNSETAFGDSRLLYFYSRGQKLLRLYEKYQVITATDYKKRNGCGVITSSYIGKDVLTFSTEQTKPGSFGTFLGHLAKRCPGAKFHFVADFADGGYFECEVRKGKMFFPQYFIKENTRDRHAEETERSFFLAC